MAAAAVAGFTALPAQAQEIERPATTTFFVSIPLDGRTAAPNFGVQFQGSRPYQFVKLDYQTFRNLPAALSAAEARLQALQKQPDGQAQPVK
jgi:hypothetical protein